MGGSDIPNQNDPSSFKVTFTKEPYKGRQYKVKLSVCKDPLCRIPELGVELEEIDRSGLKYYFNLDIDNAGLSKRTDHLYSHVHRDIAEAFVSELENEDWTNMQRRFSVLKADITENCNIDSLKPVFSIEEIEEERMLVPYHEIFPFAGQLLFSFGDLEIGLDDQYCLCPHCGCKDVLLFIIPIKEGKVLKDRGDTAVDYNYETKEWLVRDHPQHNLFQLDRVMEAMPRAFPDIAEILRERHRRLRSLYKKYRRETLKPEPKSSGGKVGRNDPCPCGSGKKYKHCCGG